MTSDSPNSPYVIQFTPLALEMLEAVKDQRELKTLGDRNNPANSLALLNAHKLELMIAIAPLPNC